MDFYDIAMREPASSNSCFTNPWKARYALNFKDKAHSTKWVSLPDIDKVRGDLGLSACRKHADGADFNTLPVLVDHSTGSKIGDSFDIAVYLQETYPTSGTGDLFPPQVLDFKFNGELPPWAPPLTERDETGVYGEYAKFNTQIDMVFSVHSGLMVYQLPLDSQASKDKFVKRSGANSWDDFEIKGEARSKLMESLRQTLADLSKLYSKDTSGPFILGEQASYADMILGGWLHMMQKTVASEEWEAIGSWNNGVFGHLLEGLRKYSEVK